MKTPPLEPLGIISLSTVEPMTTIGEWRLVLTIVEGWAYTEKEGEGGHLHDVSPFVM